ncbi:MAG TPA: porin family protein [Phnomibacter sp.]|nr:porin family protein [Phnomibacter sp.]
MNSFNLAAYAGLLRFPSFVKISFLVGFLIMSVMGNAQLQWGVKAGLNLSTSTEGHGGSETKFGGYGGAKIWVPLGKRFFLEPELLFSGKGYRNQSYNEDRSAYRFNYITVPVLFSYLFDCKTRLLAGPEIGYLVNAKANYQGSGYNETRDIMSAISSKTDVGLAMGLDHQFTKRMHAEIRYVLGLTKVHQDYSYPSRTISVAGYNRVIQVGLAYDLAKKKSQ